MAHVTLRRGLKNNGVLKVNINKDINEKFDPFLFSVIEEENN